MSTWRILEWSRAHGRGAILRFIVGIAAKGRGPAIAGIGDKAAWTGDRLQVLQGTHFFRIVVIDPEIPAEQLKAKVEAVGRKIAARAAAEPAKPDAGSAR